MPTANSREDVINAAIAIHGNKYVFDDHFVFVNTYTKAEVLCTVPGHGYFSVRPYSLTSTTHPTGCPTCAAQRVGAARRSSTESFIAAAIAVHGNKYDYSETEYVLSSEKVAIFCNTHHTVFEMTPNHHLKGKGCNECGKASKRRNVDDILVAAREAHGADRYDYSLIKDYTGVMQKVPIKCNQCQEVFEKCMNEHVHKKLGCPTCGKRRKAEERLIERQAKKAASATAQE